MRRILGGLTYANVVATLALVLALSTGTAWAASSLITGKQIKQSTLTGKHVRNGSLTGQDLKKRSIPLDRLAGGLPTGTIGPAGAAGPAGATGAKGDPGGVGPAGVQGERGPSDAYASDTPYSSAGIAMALTFTFLDTVTLPAGSYVANASVVLTNEGALSSGLVCDLVGVTSNRATATVAAGASSTIPLQAAFTTAGGVLRLRCSLIGGGTIKVNASSVHAVQVDALHQQ